jgi:hypothetical protein
VTHDPLHGGHVGAAHEQQGRRRVAEMVEPDLPHLADGEELKAAARAAAAAGIGRRLVVAAAGAPALVHVAGDETGAAHGPPEDLLELRLPREHPALLVGEDQLGGRGSDRPSKIALELDVDWNGLGATALGDVSLMRSTDDDDAGREIDVGLAQGEELALAHARVECGGEERLPLRGERGQQGRDLLGPQVLGQRPPHLPLRHVGDGVRPWEPLHPSRHGEGAAQVAAQVVHAAGAEHPLLRGEEQIDLPRRDMHERELPQLRPDRMLPDARLAGARSPSPQERLDPPLHELVDGPAAILELLRREPEALSLVLLLELEREALRVPLAGSRAAVELLTAAFACERAAWSVRHSVGNA